MSAVSMSSPSVSRAIFVFLSHCLSGHREVEYLCKKLRARFTPKVPNGKDGKEAVGEAGTAPSGDHGGLTALKSPEGDPSGEFLEGEDRAEMAADRAESFSVEGNVLEDDYEAENDSGDEDEEAVEVLGGESMTPEQIAEAEKRFEQQFSIPWKDSVAGAWGSYDYWNSQGTFIRSAAHRRQRLSYHYAINYDIDLVFQLD